MFSGAGAGQGGREVIAAGRAEADHVHVGMREQGFGSRAAVGAILTRELFRFRRGAVVGGDNLDAGDLGERLRVELGDHAGSPDTETEGLCAHDRTLAETTMGWEG